MVRVSCLAAAALLLLANFLPVSNVESRKTLHLLFVAVAGILSLSAYCFSSLRVTVDSVNIRASLGPGWIRKTIALDQISHVGIANPSRLAGYGIRYLGPGKWLWRVSGSEAVELDLVSGRKFLLGSHEPEVLQYAILQAKKQAL